MQVTVAPNTPRATASDHTSPGPRLVDARTAMTILGVRAQTLYAYVSRGRIARIADPSTGKSLFDQAALAALVIRRDRDRQPAGAVRGALDFGLPILDSRISSIRDGRLLYRDRDALTLAEVATLEQVAAVLWGATSLPDVAPEPLAAASASPAGFLDAFSSWLAEQMQCGQSGNRLPNSELIAHSTRTFGFSTSTSG